VDGGGEAEDEHPGGQVHVVGGDGADHGGNQKSGGA
jgi:hypothetical protein